MVIKKHKALLITIVALLMLIIYSIISINIKSRKFSDFIGANEQRVSKIRIMNGSNGKSIVINDKTKIKKFIGLLNKGNYKKARKQDLLIGYTFSYVFYVENKEVLKIVDSGDKIRVNEIYYDVGERNFNEIKDIC